MTPVTAVIAALVGAGVAFTAVAVVGLYRLPDVYARAHAMSKAETLGALLALAGAGVAYGSATAAMKLGALALFVLATGPTTAHVVLRSADRRGVEPWTTDDGCDDEPADDGGSRGGSS